MQLEGKEWRMKGYKLTIRADEKKGAKLLQM